MPAVKIPSDVLTRFEVDGSATVFKLTSDGHYFEIWGHAADVWRELMRGKHPDKIIDSISKKHGVSREKLKKDVSHFLSSLQEQGLIKINTE